MALARSSLRLQAPVAAASLPWVDACAAMLSGLCAVHCAVTPLLVGVLPAFAGDDVESGLRRVLLSMGLFGVGIGTWLHRDRRALVPLGGALLLAALLEVGAVVPAWEVFLSLALSALLITAHALNTRACSAQCHDCSPARFWTAQATTLRRTRGAPGMLALSAAILVHATLFAVVVRVAPASASTPKPVATTTIVDVETVTEPALSASETTSSALEPASPRASVLPGAASARVQSMPAAPPAPQAQPVAFDEVLRAEAPLRWTSVLGASTSSLESSTRASLTGNGARGEAVRPGAIKSSAAQGGVQEAARLNRPPAQPPLLGARIQAHFPPSARAQGVSGVGRVRLLVSAKGVVVQAVPLSEEPTGYGFARACANALEGSRGWGEPLDASGRPVSTWIRFSCEFAIRH